MSRLFGADRQLFWGCVVFVLAVTLVRLYYLSLEPFDLFFDESQYWGWSKDLAWGYYSKPPMIAWLIAATTSLCGDTESCVRLSAPLLHLGTAGAVYVLSGELYDRKVAVYSAVAYATLPAVTLSSMLISTDAPLLFFWAWSMVGFVKAIRTNYLKWWIFAGICAGFGMLSKYNMLMFLCSALLYLGLSKQYVAYLKSGKFWMACFLAFVLFVPNIMWNINNHFASFMHTGDNASLGFALHFNKMFEFIGAQFGVFGPIYFAVFLLLLFKFKTLIKNDSHKLLLCFILPLLSVILLVSVLSRAHANWAAPIYVPATVLVTAWLLETTRKTWINASVIIHITVAMLAMNMYGIIDALGLTLSGTKTDLLAGRVKDPLQRVRGWKELGSQVSEVWKQHPGSVLLTYTRKPHAQLLYYVTPHPFNAVKWNSLGHLKDHYDLTTDINTVADRDFLFITEYKDKFEKEYQNKGGILSYFAHSMLVREITIPLYDDYDLQYYVYHLQGFRGYDAQL